MTPTKIKEEVRAKIIEAVPDIEARNTSMMLKGIFTGLINYRDSTIHLADVLLALGDDLVGDYEMSGDTLLFLDPETDDYTVAWDWNLKETYDNQSPELYQFLHNILCKTK